MKTPSALIILTLSTTLWLSGCAQYAAVSKVRPRYRPVRNTVGVLVAAEHQIVDGLRKDRRAPEAAIGRFLTAAKIALREMEANPEDPEARATYNFAVGRIIDTIQNSRLDPWSRPLRIPSEEGEYLLTRRPDRRKAWNPALYDFTPADQFDVKGRYVSKHEVKPGVGAPLVAVAKMPNERFAENFIIPRTIYGATALVRFDGQRAEIGFEDPLSTEEVTLGKRRFPLAADFTVPLAVMLASTDTKKLELSRLLQPGKYDDTTLLARLQPFDPDKIVVLVVHGLMDSPATWTPMINSLRADPKIRDRYQFWFFSYPSGYPYPYSAALLRRNLDAIGKKFPSRHKMVVIGHSMGGCISRLLITDAGDRIWMKAFGRPPEQVKMSTESKELFVESTIFDRREEVGRVIFISSPLRGSELAQDWVGRIGSSLVRSPRTLLAAGGEAMRYVAFQGDDLRLKRIPNSVDTLSPNNRFVKIVNTIPVAKEIPHHVICGDRGKGGYKDKTKPVMTDGVVPYWSSYMDTAQSERIVPSHHPAHQHPQAIEEVRRILTKHASR